MKIAEILRKMADIIDRADQPDSRPAEINPLQDMSRDDPNRIKQIADLLTGNSCRTLQNAPQEEYAGIASVTIHAGGGVNGPKHPHDLRVKDPSQHPGQQEY
jgi:hypothetical protein